jgi:hypothetical protein
MVSEWCSKRVARDNHSSSQVARRQTSMKAEGKFFIGGNWKCNGENTVTAITMTAITSKG